MDRAGGMGSACSELMPFVSVRASKCVSVYGRVSVFLRRVLACMYEFECMCMCACVVMRRDLCLSRFVPTSNRSRDRGRPSQKKSGALPHTLPLRRRYFHARIFTPVVGEPSPAPDLAGR